MTGISQTPTMAILDAVYTKLRAAIPEESPPVSRIEAGENLVLVEVDGDQAGIAHRPQGDVQSLTDTSTLDAFEIASWAIAPPQSGSDCRRALGVAALNALSEPYIDWRRGDPMTSLTDDVSVVAMVGLFSPVLDRFRPKELRIVERKHLNSDDITAPEDVTVTTHSPQTADDAFAGADVLFITGSAFVYGGAGRYLELADKETSTVVIGPTSSFLPGPVFEAGADVVAGSIVNDVAALADIIRGDVCTTDLYSAGLEKVYVDAKCDVDGIQLGGTTTTE